MSDNLIKRRVLLLGILISIFFGVSSAFASESNGTIDTTYKYAWGENIGWINFDCDNCNVNISDTSISGNAWSTQYGWINLNPDKGGVINTAEGTLSGFAWGANLGWINFSGVTINSSGEFLGYATVKSDNSRINFNCINGSSCASANFKVKTDWRPLSARPAGGGGGGRGGGHPPYGPPEITPPVNPSLVHPIFPDIITPVKDTIKEVAKNTSDFFLDFFKPKDKIKEVAIEVPKIAPVSFQTKWNLLPVKAIREFVFAPLPYEVRILASKFPEIGQTLKTVGVNRLSDMNKLSGVTFTIGGLAELEKTVKAIGVEKLTDINKINGVALNIPIMSNAELQKTLQTLGIEKISDLGKLESGALGVSGMSNAELQKTLQTLGIEKISDLGKLKTVALSVPGFSDINGKIINSVGAGKIALIKGLPVTKFPLVAKQNLPTEFVFARAGGELVDLNVALSVGDKGEVTQKISSLPGKTLRLVVKPISKARSVTGYFVFKSATPRISKTEISRSSLTASALSSLDDLVEKAEPIPVENKLVLSSFEYTDPDHDGIYTADVISPVVPGEYEVITVIDYLDPVLGVRQMRMITVIDPEGYVFEKNNGKETRIPSAVVSLFSLNTVTKKYELWPSKEYQQENPQITDIRGTYSFLVPEGSYYFEVEAPGYDSYNGKVFVVTEGSGIHQNIELNSSGRSLLADIDWKTILLFVVLLLLVYNLYRNREQNKLLKLLNKNDRK